MDNNVLAVPAVAAIMVITEAFKEVVPNRYLPLVALFLGVAFGLLENKSLPGLIQGILYGGSAMGLYRGYKVAVKGE